MFKPIGSIYFTASEMVLIRDLLTLADPWAGNVGTHLPRKSATERNTLKKRILDTLLELQGIACLYCCSIDPIRENFTVDHFANKSKDSYRIFTFEPLNLIAACRACNMGLKKSENTILRINASYRDSDFLYFHPLIHELEMHFEIYGDFNSVIVPTTTEAKRFFSMFRIWDRYELIIRNRESIARRLPSDLESTLNEILSRPRIKR